jgi:MFS family permease
MGRSLLQFGLLGRARSFRLLFLATFGSGIGTLLAAVALAIDVKDRTGSGLWVAGLLVSNFLPSIVVGLVLGPYVDRLSRRGLMIGSDLARVAVFAALPFVGHAGGIVALATVAGFATGLFRPSVYAGLPNLVDDEELPAANSLLQSSENLTWAAGPVLGGLVVAARSPGVAYWINAATFLVSAALLARIPARALHSTAPVSKGHWRDLGDGFALVRASRPLVAVLVAWTIAMLSTGYVNVGEIFIAKDALDAGDFGYGLIFGSIGAGLVLGSFAGGPLVGRIRIPRLYGGSRAVRAVGIGGAAASPNVWVAAACCAVAGVGNGAAIVCNALLVQRGAPDELRGRAFTVIFSVNYLVLGAGMALAGVTNDALGPRWTWAIASGTLAVAALAGWVLTARIGEARPARLEPQQQVSPEAVEARQ